MLKKDILNELDKWENWCILQYTNHPLLCRFVICVFLAFLSLIQHLLEKQGVLNSFSLYVGSLISIITKFILGGGG